MADFTERDWKYLRSIRDDMLASLCARINQGASEILARQGESEHTKYLKLYRYIKESDGIVAECFDDWRRSRLAQRVFSLVRHKVLTQEQFNCLTPGAQEMLKKLESVYQIVDDE